MAGYIGNNPSDSSVRIARQKYTSSASQTDFEFTAGYDPGYLEVYVNGIKQTEGTNFTANDGQNFVILNGIGAGNTVTASAYKTFNVATVTLSEVTDVDDLTVTGAINAGSADVGIATINSSGIDAGVGIVTGVFSGDGSSLTGVASTDNIITGTAATFNNEVHVGVALTIGYAGVATFSGAGGIGVTITPSTGKVEASEIRANEFYGDGSNLEGIAAGLGTALGDSAPLSSIFKTPNILSIGAATSVRVDSDASSGFLAFMRESDIHVASGSTFHIGSGTTLVADVLNIFNVT